MCCGCFRRLVGYHEIMVELWKLGFELRCVALQAAIFSECDLSGGCEASVSIVVA